MRRWNTLRNVVFHNHRNDRKNEVLPSSRIGVEIGFVCEWAKCIEEFHSASSTSGIWGRSSTQHLLVLLAKIPGTQLFLNTKSLSITLHDQRRKRRMQNRVTKMSFDPFFAVWLLHPFATRNATRNLESLPSATFLSLIIKKSGLETTLFFTSGDVTPSKALPLWGAAKTE